jgi:hypothetical protein
MRMYFVNQYIIILYVFRARCGARFSKYEVTLKVKTMNQESVFETKKTIDHELEIILMSELFENLQDYSCLRHDDLAVDLTRACKEWANNCPHSAEKAINLMGVFLPMLGLYGRMCELINDKSQYYTRLSDEIGK